MRETDVTVIFTTDNSLSEKYQQYGTKVVDRIEGEFSFALYDQKNDIYLAARDPLGVKTLYYTKTQNRYRFSNDISELLALPTVEKKPNLASMRTMLECQAVDHNETMYEDIYRLPPGHTLTIEQGNVSIERYWYPEKIEIDYDISDKEAAAKLKILFEKAVEKRIDNLKETAFELSGGLDSSSVVAELAKKEDPSSIATYSLGFEGIDCDESEYVDAMLHDYPLRHTTVPVVDLDYDKQYSLAYLYTLSPNWPITITFAMSLPMVEQMKDDGKKVIVSGQGGDHLFTGTPNMMSDLLRRGQFLSLYKELKHYKHPLSIWKNYALRPLLNPKFVETLRRLVGKKPLKPSPQQKCKKMDADFMADIKSPTKKFDLDMITWALHTTLMDGNLFHCVEKHFGMEYRHPFFDRALVEFTLSLPPDMKYRERNIKWIWRKAMQGILPEKIRERRDKAEFSEVLMRQIDAVDLDELLDDPCIVKLGLIEKEKLDEYREAYTKRSKKYTVAFWSAINVEYWYLYNGFDCP